MNTGVAVLFLDTRRCAHGSEGVCVTQGFVIMTQYLKQATSDQTPVWPCVLPGVDWVGPIGCSCDGELTEL